MTDAISIGNWNWTNVYRTEPYSILLGVNQTQHSWKGCNVIDGVQTLPKCVYLLARYADRFCCFLSRRCMDCFEAARPAVFDADERHFADFISMLVIPSL